MKPKIIFNISRTPCYYNEHKTERKLAAHGDCCSIANCRIKLSVMFRGTCGIFRDISEYLFLYSTLYPGSLGWKRRVKTRIILALSTSFVLIKNNSKFCNKYKKGGVRLLKTETPQQFYMLQILFHTLRAENGRPM